MAGAIGARGLVRDFGKMLAVDHVSLVVFLLSVLKLHDLGRQRGD
jgi:hypothetical protein